MSASNAMSPDVTGIVSLSFAWIAYFFIHTLLASISAKKIIERHLPFFSPYYRLSYNVLSFILLLPVLFFMHSLDGSSLWKWEGMMFIISSFIAILCGAGFLSTLKYYDTSEFTGMKQILRRNNASEEEQAFTLSPLHRYVRHPWYFLAIVIIWTRDMNYSFFISAILITLYFIIGSRLEEGKLVLFYGERYREYMKKVPGVFPLPWKYLNEEEAIRLQSKE